MTRRRWIYGRSGTWVVFAISAVVFVLLREWSTAVIATSAALCLRLQLAAAIELYRAGFWRGRVSGLLHPHAISSTDPAPWDPPDPAPWQP